MTEEKNQWTTFVYNYDNRSIHISVNLKDCFLFLADIEKEIHEMLGYHKKLTSIREKFSKIMDGFGGLYIEAQSKWLEYDMSFLKDPSLIEIVTDFNSNQIIRSQMICVFAYMETLFCILTVYIHELEDEEAIKCQSNKDLKMFISKYLLHPTNGYYKLHVDRFRKIVPDEILTLRNLLTHFYSVGSWIVLVNDLDDEEVKKLAQEFMEKIGPVFMTPEDFLGLLNGCMNLLFQEWTNTSNKQSEEFNRKFSFVEKIVNSHAPKFVDMVRQEKSK